jgi:hypothetical protein
MIAEPAGARRTRPLTVPVTAVSIWSQRRAARRLVSPEFAASYGWYPTCSTLLAMRRKLPLLFLGLLLVGAGLSYAAQAIGLEQRIAALANQPDVRTAFQHRESGRSDALTTLIAAAIVTPMTLGAALMLGVLIVKMFEAVLASVHLPPWLSLPLVGTSAIVAIYVTSTLWLPHSLHVLGLVARAYLVYSYTSPPPVVQ